MLCDEIDPILGGLLAELLVADDKAACIASSFLVGFFGFFSAGLSTFVAVNIFFTGGITPFLLSVIALVCGFMLFIVWNTVEFWKLGLETNGIAGPFDAEEVLPREARPLC